MNLGNLELNMKEMTPEQMIKALEWLRNDIDGAIEMVKQGDINELTNLYCMWSASRYMNDFDKGLIRELPHNLT